MARRFAYLVAACLLAVTGLLAAAPAASAHAALVSSSPADGTVLAYAPARVTLTFDERVYQISHSIRVYSPTGARVDTGPTRYGLRAPDITVALLPHLADGTYTVGWHVISDDSHPVQGAFTFSVGALSGTAVNPATLNRPTSALVTVAFGVVRWLAFCSFALLIGAVAFVIWCWPAGATRPAVLRLTMGAWGALAFSVLAAVLLQGVYGAAQGIGHVFWPDVLHATLHSRYGRALGVRLLLVVAALFVFTVILGRMPAAGRRERVTTGAIWGVLTATLAGTWAAADHSGTGPQVPLALSADVIHLSAMAIWLGGLATLAAIVLRRPPGPARGAARRRGQAAPAEAALAVVRFSPIALSCVAALVVTGTYQAWRDVGTLGALPGTTYGRLLLVKVAAMCTLISLGYLARRRIAESLAAAAAVVRARPAATPAGRIGVKAGAAPRRAAGNGVRPGQRRAGTVAALSRGDGPSKGERPETARVTVTLARLRWSVTAEAAIAAAVLAVTAVLVNTPTAREAYTPARTASVSFGTGRA